LFNNPSDEELRSLLASTRRIAIVGLSPKPWRDSNAIGRYLLERGYAIFPVYPRETEILGQKVHRSTSEIPGGVDLVNVFRRGEFLPDIVDDALKSGSPSFWFQLDCVSAEAARRGTLGGRAVVMDRCIRVDHQRLLGREWRLI